MEAEMHISFGKEFPEDLHLLELSDALIAQLENGLSQKGSTVTDQAIEQKTGLVLRGRPGDTAVLCAPDDNTYKVRKLHTSNSLYVVKRRHDDTTTNTNATTNTSSEAAETSATATTQPTWDIISTKDVVLELLNNQENLHGRIGEILAKDPRGDYLGPDFEAKDVKNAKSTPKITFETLQYNVQASDARIRKALAMIPAVCVAEDGNSWRRLGVKYVVDTLLLIAASMVENDWDYNELDLTGCIRNLIDDVEEEGRGGDGGDGDSDNEMDVGGSNLTPEVLKAIFEFFGTPVEGRPNVYAIQGERVARFMASKVFDTEKGKDWKLDDFLDTWRSVTPPLFHSHIPKPGSITDTSQISKSLLRDLAYATTGSVATGIILHPFPRDNLPLDPVARFRALFSARPKWTRPEIEPFLEDLVLPKLPKPSSSSSSSVPAPDTASITEPISKDPKVKKEIDVLLLKYTRSAKNGPNGQAVLSSRVH
ncbi:Sister chromatid cohesion protein DCC1 [Mycoemilia scoparia]|uniref:Sister chromatid cohesion protein DCC1 n=1 Tax=Mycoemilia scoparia TaxID=417184 RepID=A0A9W7ZX50_9FUNG|nr:Sister chromatid cohesion protein DCC1 [Mycoemilia scoparia]